MSHKRWILITLILLLAAIGRILHISQQSFWVDEGYAFYHAAHPDLFTSLARDTHPPLYFAALRLWSEIAGHSEVALRWFSLLPSMLSLALVYQLARELCHHRRRETPPYADAASLFALLMLALADSENFLAQEARHYTWLVLLVLGGMCCFLRWMRTRRKRAFRCWILLTIALLHTHYISAFAAVAQGLYALLFLRGRMRLQALSGLIISAAAFLPWLLTVGRYQLGNTGANWSVDLSSAVARDILVKYFTEQWALIIALMLLGCFALIKLRAGRMRIEFQRVSWLPLFWIALPFLLTLIANEFLPFLQPRRLTQWTPAIAVLVAFGLANIPGPARGLLLGALLVYGVLQVDFYRLKPDWRAVAALTSRFALPGQLLLTDISGGDYQMGYYLRRDVDDGISLPPDIRYESLKIRRDFYPEDYQEWLPQLLDGHETVWLMRWSDDRSAFAWLELLAFQRTADFIYRHDGGAAGRVDLHVYRYDRMPDGPIVARWQNGIVLQSAEVDVEDLRVDLLMRTLLPQSENYAISAKLLDAAGVLRAQFDSQPQLNQRPTSGWSVGELIYSPQELLPQGRIEPGEYRLMLQLYLTVDEGFYNLPTIRGGSAVDLGAIEIMDDHWAARQP